MIRRRSAGLIAALACGILIPQAEAGDGKPAEKPSHPEIRPVQVHSAGHYLQTDDGRPFFWLGDTAWELFHRTTRDECTYYLRTRARQGFTVVQAVALTRGLI